MFDGNLFRFQNPGEFSLIRGKPAARGKRSVSLSFDMNVRQVISSATEQTVAIDAVGIKVGSTILAVYGRKDPKDVTGSVWLNGQPSEASVSKDLGSGISYKRIAVHHYRLSAASFESNIYVRGQFLEVLFDADYQLCKDLRGLFGNCLEVGDQSFVTATGQVLSGDQLSQASIHDVFGDSWRVAEPDSLFRERAFIAGQSLFFNQTSAVTEPLYTFSNASITIEFKFKVDSSHRGCGAVYSYNVKDEPISFLVCDTQVSIHCSLGFRNATSISLLRGQWYHVSLVWIANTKDLMLVLIKGDGTVLQEVLSLATLSYNPLAPGGAVMIGQWNGRAVDNVKIWWSFIGWVDEVRIWNTQLTSTQIRQYSTAYVSASTKYLVNYWRFNSGIDLVLHDSVAGAQMSIKQSPAPAWRSSGVVLQAPSLSVYNVYRLADKASGSRIVGAKTYCTRLMGISAFSSCSAELEEGVVSFYYDQCVYSVYSQQNNEAAMDAVLAFSYHCYALSATSTAWPAQSLCQEFPTRHFPDWIGQNCDVPCVSGFKNSTQPNECLCYDGFWGTTCNNMCPATSIGACGYGSCSKIDGQCSCPVGLKQASHCVECENDWYGIDCSSAKVSLPSVASTTKTCVLFSHSHFIMFDGQSYTMTQSGEFTLFASPALASYIRQVPCGNRSNCISSIWIATDGVNITIKAPRANSKDHYIYFNQTLTEFEEAQNLTDNVLLEMITEKHVRLSHTAGGVKINVYIHERFLGAEVRTETGSCEKTGPGLCGNCDGDLNNDFQVGSNVYVGYSKVSANIINGAFANYTKLRLHEPAFVYDNGNVTEPRIIGNGGYGLWFNGTNSSFTDQLHIFTASDNVTLEFKFKIDIKLNASVILTYAGTKGLTVSLRGGTICLHVGTRIFDTGIRPEYHAWQHLTLVYHRNTDQLLVYHINSTRFISTASFSVGSILTPGGVLYLGDWSAGPSFVEGRPSGIPKHGFLGEIDELRIWRGSLSLYDVLQRCDLKLDASYQGLAAYWEFDEGFGNKARDIHGHFMTLPKLNGSVYWLSGLSLIVDNKQEDAIDVSANLTDEEKYICEQRMNNSTVSEACGELGNASRDLFYAACLQDTFHHSDPKDYKYAYISYAQYCMAALDLDVDLVADICQNDTDLVRDEICIAGSDCKFGVKDDNGTCICNKGYWGERCHQRCPGTLEAPCNDHGVCNVTTGQCHCEGGWTDESQCQKCSLGWIAPNCSVNLPVYANLTVNATIRVPNNPAFTIFGSGHVIAFSGLKYTFAAYGEYYLIRDAVASAGQLSVHARFTQCNNGSLCLSGIALRRNTDTVIIRAGYTSSHTALLWYNNKRIVMEGTRASFTHITISHDSTNQYTISDVSSQVQIKVLVNDYYLSLAVSVHPSLCGHPDSLAGPCKGNLNTNNVTSGLRAIVPPGSSLFNIIFTDSLYHERSELSGAGFCLWFNQTYISSDPLLGILADKVDISLEFHLRVASQRGVVLSYSYSSVFAIVLDGTLKLQFGAVVLDTQFQLSLQQWHHIICVWQWEVQTLTIYLYSESGTLRYKEFTSVATGVFVSGGTLSIGRWYQPFDRSITPVVSEGFVGEVDEMRIYQKAFTQAEIQLRRGLAVFYDEIGLVGHWRFDEGFGDVIKDHINGSHLYAERYSWTNSQPAWRFSYAHISPALQRYNHVIHNATLALMAREICTTIVFDTSINGPCYAFGPAIFEFYYVSCMKQVAETGELSATMSVAVSLADQCLLQLQPPSWPAQQLCWLYPGIFPTWRGYNCAVQCNFPAPGIDPDRCTSCEAGFWSRTCSSVCPGGLLRPCGNHGTCERLSGSCECQWNWAGAGCHECAAGWHGADCSVTVELRKPHKRHCTMTANGYLTTFDQASVLYQETGVLRYYQDAKREVTIDIMQRPCADLKVCTIAFALNVKGTNVSIDASNSTAGAQVYMNNQSKIVIEKLDIVGGYRLERVDPYEYIIKGDADSEIKITLRETYINVHMKADGKLCKEGTNGLCGPCKVPKSGSTCNDGDYKCHMRATGLAQYSLEHTVNSTMFREYLDTFKLTHSQSLFRNSQIPTSSNYLGGYALYIKDLSVVSELWKEPIDSDQHITVQIRLKVFNGPEGYAGGIIMSYATSETFAIGVTNRKLSVHYNGTVDVTDITVSVDVWGQISLVYDKEMGILVLHYVTSQTSMYQVLNISTGYFPPGGTLAIGKWQVTDGLGQSPAGSFVGIVDSLSVWKRRFGPVELTAHWLDIMTRIESGITSVWHLDEGYGLVANSSVKDTSIRISSRHAWVQSGMPLRRHTPKNFTTALVYTIGQSEKETANRTCTKLLYTGTLNQQCGALENFTRRYFWNCLTSIAQTGNLNSAIDPVLDFASVCQVALHINDKKWPAKTLCSEFPGRNFPIWIGPTCDTRCIFGKKQYTSDVCVCDRGFWGESCTKECPGGSARPCSDHGECDAEKGKCTCGLRWQGKRCDSCGDGWTGVDCSIEQAALPAGHEQTCMADEDGAIRPFNGAAIQVTAAATYQLIAMENLELQVGLLCVCVCACAYLQWFNINSLVWAENYDNSFFGIYFNPSNAVTTFAQGTRMQRFLTTILTLSFWCSLDKSH